MKFCSTYLWEKGSGQEYHPVSLVLQQAEVRKQSVLLACVCRGVVEEVCEVLAVEVSGYFTEALVEWFHRECLELVEQKRRSVEPERSLQKELETIYQELLLYGRKKGVTFSMDCVGVLLVEQRFWMFSMGKGRIFLLNRRYNRKHMRCIMGNAMSNGKKDSFFVEKGILQRKIGLLLCVDELEGQLDKNAVAEALLVEGRMEGERIQRRLKEVWNMKKECVENGKAASSADVGVVYFMTY